MPNVYEVITARIIEQLEAGTAPWQKPWKASGRSGLPRNLVSGREYRGINVWILLSSRYRVSELAHIPSSKRAWRSRSHKARVGFPVVYWKFGKREVQDGDEIIEKPSVSAPLLHGLQRSSNAKGSRFDQPSPSKTNHQPIEACEQVVADWLGKAHDQAWRGLRKLQQSPRFVQMPERPASTAWRNTTNAVP